MECTGKRIFPERTSMASSEVRTKGWANLSDLGESAHLSQAGPAALPIQPLNREVFVQPLAVPLFGLLLAHSLASFGSLEDLVVSS